MDKLIINLAPTGIKPCKSDNPNTPLSPGEIISDCVECARQGASIFHLHAREEDGSPSFKKSCYQRTIEGIRSHVPDAIICVSTSGRVYGDLSKRSEVLDLEGDSKPDMASLTLGSLNFLRESSINHPETIVALTEKMEELGIMPELEIFDFGMIDYLKWLTRKNILKAARYANIILGAPVFHPMDLSRLPLMVRELPEGLNWAAGAIGTGQISVNTMAIAMGGHVRTGLEDNLFLDNERTRFADNLELTKRIAEICRLMGREVATPIEARQILGIRKK